jgi:hypothetical protein
MNNNHQPLSKRDRETKEIIERGLNDIESRGASMCNWFTLICLVAGLATGFALVIFCGFDTKWLGLGFVGLLVGSFFGQFFRVYSNSALSRLSKEVVDNFEKTESEQAAPSNR